MKMGFLRFGCKRIYHFLLIAPLPRNMIVRSALITDGMPNFFHRQSQPGYYHT